MRPLARPRTGRWFVRAVALTALGVSSAVGLEAIVAIPLLMVIVVAFETMCSRSTTSERYTRATGAPATAAVRPTVMQIQPRRTTEG